MRISFDRQTFLLQRYGGISRHFTDLYLGLSKQSGIEADLLFNKHQNTYLSEHGIGQKLNPIVAKLYIKALARGNLNLSVGKHKGIHHATYYLGRPQRVNKEAKLVSTLYDMTPELYPHYFKGNPHYNKLDWFKASDLIISISDSAAADLAYFQPALANKIRRIHLCSGFQADSPQSKPQTIGIGVSPYALFVGQRGGYKNGAMLMRAFAASEPSRHGHRLLFAGGGAFSEPELADIERLGITAYVQQVDVNDAELWYLYRQASALLVPSLAEGFSFPLVEGLAADVPVICSDNSAHREVAGDFGEQINPLQHQDWADIIRIVHRLRRPSEKLGLEMYGERCRYFSKKRIVEEHVKAYLDIGICSEGET
jgi:glycosyltransferase involved in cell wall biosynthesis